MSNQNGFFELRWLMCWRKFSPLREVHEPAHSIRSVGKFAKAYCLRYNLLGCPTTAFQLRPGSRQTTRAFFILSGHEVRREKPFMEGHMATLHHRSGSNGELVAAVAAKPVICISRRRTRHHKAQRRALPASSATPRSARHTDLATRNRLAGFISEVSNGPLLHASAAHGSLIRPRRR